MNPDRLFDYLDGRLPENERHALEEELMNDAEARREFDVARRIHLATRGTRDNLEVLDESALDASRGRRAARQVLLATLVLVAVNVLLGLLYIAHHEAKNPNRALLEKQNREQLREALNRAAAGALKPPPLGVAELSVTTPPGRALTVADEIVRLAKQLNAAATKGIPDGNQVKVLVEMPANRVDEFRASLANLAEIRDVDGNIVVRTGSKAEEKISVVVQVTEAK